MKKWLPLLLLFSVFIACNREKEKKQKSEDPVQAEIDRLTEAILDSPNNAALFHERGLMYWRHKDNELALNDFYKMTSIDSTKPQYYETLAEFFVDNLNIERGIKALDFAKNLDPTNAKYDVMQGRYALYIKDYKKSLAYLNSALVKDKFIPDPYVFKSMVFLETGDTAKAISNLMTAIEQDPSWSEPYEILGSVYAAQGNDLAIKYFDYATKADPQNTSAQSQKAYYYKQKGDIDKASKEYEDIVIHHPQDPDAIYNLSVISYDQKDYKKSLKQAEICMSIDPANALAQYMIGKNQLALGQKEKAKYAFENAYILDTTMVEAKKEFEKL